jgi:hypothetical protein
VRPVAVASRRGTIGAFGLVRDLAEIVARTVEITPADVAIVVMCVDIIVTVQGGR